MRLEKDQGLYIHFEVFTHVLCKYFEMIRLNNQQHMADLVDPDVVYVIHAVHHHEQTVDHVDLQFKEAEKNRSEN